MIICFAIECVGHQAERRIRTGGHRRLLFVLSASPRQVVVRPLGVASTLFLLACLIVILILFRCALLVVCRHMEYMRMRVYS